jgi:glycosyltransferase involved in cell wall biosynthesis
MNIAIFSDEYMPNGTRVHSKMLHELAVELLGRGHELTVITPGSCTQQSLLDIDQLDGVVVWRFKSPPTRGVGLFRRAGAEAMLSPRAWFAIRGQFKKNKIDLCLNYSPTIFFGPLAYYFKLNGAFVYLILRDFFPQWIIDQGLISHKSLPAKFFRFFERWNYNIADHIGVQAPSNERLLTERYPELSAKSSVLYNWAAYKENTGSSVFEQIGLTSDLKDKVIFFYGGNLGRAQDIPALLKLAQKMLPYSDAHFLFIGDGDQVSLVSDAAGVLGNITFRSSISQSLFDSLLEEVHVGLFSLAAEHTANNFPGKLLGYMVKKLPVLGTVNHGNDLKEVYERFGAGIVLTAGQDDLLFDGAVKLLGDVKLRKDIGEAAGKMHTQLFSVEAAANNILRRFEEGVSK